MAGVDSEVKLYASYISMMGNCFHTLLHRSRCASSREVAYDVKIGYLPMFGAIEVFVSSVVAFCCSLVRCARPSTQRCNCA